MTLATRVCFTFITAMWRVDKTCSFHQIFKYIMSNFFEEHGLINLIIQSERTWFKQTKIQLNWIKLWLTVYQSIYLTNLTKYLVLRADFTLSVFVSFKSNIVWYYRMNPVWRWALNRIEMSKSGMKRNWEWNFWMPYNV